MENKREAWMVTV